MTRSEREHATGEVAPPGAAAGRPILEARDVSRSWPGQPRPAVAEVDLALTPGTVAGLVGPNGAGKSTLLRLLGGLLRADRGEVWLAGEPLGGLGRRAIARRLAFVPQEVPVEVPFTVREVVLTGRHPHVGLLASETHADHARVEAALEAMSLEALADRRIDSLSGGERQRVFVARALAADPAVLLLDEPAAHLDLGHRMDLGQRLQDLAAERDVAVVVVHHDLNLAADTCPQLHLLAGGRMLASGPAADVLTAENVREAYAWSVEVDTNPLTHRPRVTPHPAPG